MANYRRIGVLALLAMLAGCGMPVQPAPVATAAVQATAVQGTDPLLAPLRRTFAALDRDGRGLTPDVFPLTPESWQELDRDHDGRLRWQEVQPDVSLQGALSRAQRQAADAVFAEADQDHDGRLSRVELLSHSFLAQLQADFRFAERLAFPLSGDGLARSLATILADERLEQPGVVAPNGPGHGRTVFLAHGLWAPGWYYFYPLKRHLEAQGFRVYAMNFIPTLPRIEDYALQLQGVINKHRQAGHFDRFDLIGHSMGGLVGRYYERRLGGEALMDHYVSFATPHQGSKLAWLGPLTITKQLRPGSDFLRDLDTAGLSSQVQHAALWTQTDGMVIPGSYAQLKLAGARNFPAIPHSNHYLICFQPTSFGYVDEALQH